MWWNKWHWLHTKGSWFYKSFRDWIRCRWRTGSFEIRRLVFGVIWNNWWFVWSYSIAKLSLNLQLVLLSSKTTERWSFVESNWSFSRKKRQNKIHNRKHNKNPNCSCWQARSSVLCFLLNEIWNFHLFVSSKIHILGSFKNIAIARNTICTLILGSPPSKVYGKLRNIASRVAESFWEQVNKNTKK